MDQNQDFTHMTFPCEFPIKVVGKSNDAFELKVLTIIRKHVKDLKDNAISMRLSKDKNYQALTITIHAENQEQLDAIYRELSSAEEVLMAL